MRNFNAQALTGVENTTVNGTQFDSNQWVSASFHLFCSTGSGAGTLKLQASNDTVAQGSAYATPQVPLTVTNWVDIPNQAVTVASGASGLLTIPNMTYRFIRAVWTGTGGVGTATVNVNALSI